MNTDPLGCESMSVYKIIKSCTLKERLRSDELILYGDECCCWEEEFSPLLTFIHCVKLFVNAAQWGTRSNSSNAQHLCERLLQHEWMNENIRELLDQRVEVQVEVEGCYDLCIVKEKNQWIKNLRGEHRDDFPHRVPCNVPLGLINSRLITTQRF